MADATFRPHLGKRFDRSLETGFGIDPVKLIEVDPFEPQPRQAAEDRLPDRGAAAVGGHLRMRGVGLPGAEQPTFGADHEPGGVGRQCPRDQPLVGSGTIGFRRVDKIHAERHGAAQQRDRHVRLGRLAPTRSPQESGRTEADAEHRQIAADREM